MTKLKLLGNWFMSHAKILMPAILAVCVVVTIVIAVNANKKDAEKQEGVEANSTLEETTDDNTLVVPQVPLQENTDPKIDELIHAYYTAMAEGDTDTIRELVDNLDETEVLRTQESSKYIESYPTIEIYTKAGLKENTVLVYVCSEVKFIDVDQTLPGMKGFYVQIDENGKYCIIDEDRILDKDEAAYMQAVALQDDVVDMNNRVAAQYNEMVESDADLAEFLYDMTEEIKKNVGQALAEAEENIESEEGTDTETANAESESEGTDNGETATVVTRVRATDVVNIRSSDSETADKLGKAAIGDEFRLLEKIGNGWSKIEYEGSEAYIKSEFLEDIETTEVAETTENENNAQEATVTGTVTVKENVRIRSAASETSDKLGVAYAGDKLEVVMKRADGWTEIKYNGKTAYVKSDYVE